MDTATTGFHERAVRIAADLRQAIVSRTFGPGDRVPSRDELTRRYGVSKATVQRALQTLTAEGFVQARGNQGTFVAHTSPHLTRYYLLLPSAIVHPGRNQAWQALALAAAATEGDAEIICHRESRNAAGRETYEQMLDDVTSDRVAGIIFAESPFEYNGTPLLSKPGIPRTAIASKPLFQGLPVVTHDFSSFFDLSLGLLAERGCRRPAFMSTGGLSQYMTAGEFPRLLDKYGMRTPAHWHQTGEWCDTRWIANLVKLLFDYPPDQRPDGLVIANDNFVERATQTLAELGLAETLPVVAQCNFPYPTPAHMPVRRVGFSITECLRLLRRNIDLQRQGKTPPNRQLLPAIVEGNAPAN